jgi:hypothetical protein
LGDNSGFDYDHEYDHEYEYEHEYEHDQRGGEGEETGDPMAPRQHLL